MCPFRSLDTKSNFLYVLVLCVLNAQFTQATGRQCREELLDIGKVHHKHKNHLLDCDFLLRLDPTNTSQQDMAAPASHEWRSQQTVCPRQWQGRKGGIHARLKARGARPLLPMLLSNVQSLKNKMDELRTRITIQSEGKGMAPSNYHGNLAREKSADSALLLHTHTI